jgi:acyl carrier protein
MEREEVLKLINLVLVNNGNEPTTDSEIGMREAGIRSLYFSEVALRLEEQLGRELNFEASSMRRISSVRDVIDFFILATNTDVPLK